ncbi:MAG: hypothetical protein QGG40_09440, partial [Myxococcota bacterium]|nr:hypothetical protein [Myxococcota bacterium]
NKTVTVTNADDDTVGFSLSTTTVSVTEAGTTDTFTVVLDTEPVSDVVIRSYSSDSGEAQVGGPLTFTSLNWATPQTFTITGVDDDIDDGDQSSTATVVVNAGSTADSVYDALGMAPAAPIGVTTTDDDTVGFTLSTTSVSVAESVAVSSDPVLSLLETPGRQAPRDRVTRNVQSSLKGFSRGLTRPGTGRRGWC